MRSIGHSRGTYDDGRNWSEQNRFRITIPHALVGTNEDFVQHTTSHRSFQGTRILDTYQEGDKREQHFAAEARVKAEQPEKPSHRQSEEQEPCPVEEVQQYA